MSVEPFINITAYKFVSVELTELNDLRTQLLEQAKRYAIKGTILLSTEGINVFVAGTRANIDAFKRFMTSLPPYQALQFKESESVECPFSRMLVRIKAEIITMGHPEVQPEKQTAPYLSAEQLKAWYDNKHDFVMLDTRNDYEVALGSFDNAIDLNIETFKAFPDAVMMLPEEAKTKPVVTFCTGGIRCEKAAEYMLQKGFQEVYQLEGGILKYFEEAGGAHYHGDCFVFDKRLTVDAELNATDTINCYQHRDINNAYDLQKSVECPYCQHIRESRQTEKSAH